MWPYMYISAVFSIGNECCRVPVIQEAFCRPFWEYPKPYNTGKQAIFCWNVVTWEEKQHWFLAVVSRTNTAASQCCRGPNQGWFPKLLQICRWAGEGQSNAPPLWQDEVNMWWAFDNACMFKMYQVANGALCRSTQVTHPWTNNSRPITEKIR